MYNGACPVIERGVVWSSSPNPTTSSFKSICGNGTGSYICSMQNLLSNALYYARAYIVTVLGTFYGEQQNFTSAVNTSLGVGQTYAGGIIFYLDSTGQHGLVCASNDQGTAIWGCAGTSIPGTSTEVGSGASNTAAIIAGCNEINYAAKICDNLVLNGYNDWFMPSKDEMLMMYQRLRLNGIGNFQDAIYWTSSQGFDGVNTAWIVDINLNDTYGGFFKNNSKYVRAIRAF